MSFREATRENRMDKSLMLILLVAVMFFTFDGCSLLTPEVENIPDIDAAIDKLISGNKIPSVAACIIKTDKIEWQNYYGFADKSNQKVPDQETIYPLASVSKLILVTAVMQLVEKGFLNLNSDINDYFNFSVRNPYYLSKKITPSILLTHTSGLAWPKTDEEVPGFYNYYPYDSAPPLNEWLPEYILPDGDHFVPAVWKKTIPGERELYSNIGTALLGFLIEVISGTDFNTYCKQNIFEPLEMFQTSFAYSDLDMEKMAKMYGENYQLIDYYRQLSFPTQSLSSSIEDFSHFIIAYMNGGFYKNSRILKEATINEILEIQNPASGLCLIWVCSVGNWFGHAGGEPGASSFVEFQRDDSIGIIIFSNKRNKLVYPGNEIHAYIRKEAEKYH